MTPRQCKLALTSHIVFSVGWLGAVVAFLVLSIAGLVSRDTETVRGAYLSMNLIGFYVVVPVSLASLVSGLVLSFGTEWGLFRYYWIAIKFLLTIFATAALMLHQFTAVAKAAKLAATPFGDLFPIHDLSKVGTQLVGDASLAIIVLLGATILAVYKPWGLTSYGLRRRRETVSLGTAPVGRKVAPTMTRGLKIFLCVIIALVAMFLVLHLADGGLGHHAH